MIECWIKEDFSRIKRICFSFTRDNVEKEELASITFEKIWKNRFKFKGKTIEEFRGWYYVIVRTSFYNKLNQRRARGECELSIFDCDIIDRTISKLERTNLLYRMMDNCLSKDKIDTLHLSFDGFTHKEIGNKLGVGFSAIEARVRFSKIALTNATKHYRDEYYAA